MKRSIVFVYVFICLVIGAQAQYGDYYSIINGTKYRPGVKKMVEKGAYVDAYYMLQVIKSEGYSIPNPPTDYNNYLKLTTEKVTDQVVADLIPYDKDTKPIVEMAASMGYKPAKDYLNPPGYNNGVGGMSTSSRETFTVNNVQFTMVRVVGNGTPYYIGETEVTQALWQAVMGNTISDQRDKANTSWSLGAVGSDYPMYFVNYDDCEQFVRRLNSLTGRNFRIPSESEWKYAAKGGSYTHNYEHSGSNNVEEVGWVSTNGNNTQHLVKMKKANELGIYDMSGNVCEWTKSMQNSYRIGLGGSFSSKMVINPITHNYTFESTGRYSNLGFRLVL